MYLKLRFHTRNFDNDLILTMISLFFNENNNITVVILLVHCDKKKGSYKIRVLGSTTNHTTTFFVIRKYNL